MVERNAEVPEDRRILFRIGIHLGDVVEERDGDLMGEASTSPHGSRASPSRARSAFPRTPIAKSKAGSISQSAISARSSSRTSPSRSGSIRFESAFARRQSP
jgi:hypothetical protein